MANLTPIEVVDQRLHEDVKRYGKIETFSAKSSLYTPDEMQKYFFFVLEGRIKVYQIHFEDAKEQTLMILQSGDMYDVVTLLDGQLHENILEAIDDVKIILFPIEIVRNWMHEDENFNRLLLPYLAKQMRHIEELALDLSFLDTSKRLLKLISKELDPSTPHSKLLHNLTHEEIASLIGTVRKVLNRHIQKLKRDGILSVSRKNIEIKDRQKLLAQLPIEP